MRRVRLLISVSALIAIGTAMAIQTPDRSRINQTARAALPFPGVSIDWPNKSVRAAGRIVLREGPLEFVACGPGKEHESLILLDGSATHLYQALGLVGFEPGHPPEWDESAGGYSDPAGSLLEIAVAWETPNGPREASVFSWIREAAYGRTARPVPWVFGGSKLAPDKRLAADVSGSIVALVDFADSVLSLTRRRSAVDAALWAQANTDAIPPLGTPVTLVLRKPPWSPPSMQVDSRGDIWVDGRYEPLPAVLDLIRMARQLDPDHVQTIEVGAALKSDLRRIRRILAGPLPEDAIRMQRD